MTRRIVFVSIACLIAQLSTGCCLLERVANRIRSCHGCYPRFNNPGYGGPVMGGASFGGAGYGECSSCSSAGYGAESYGAAPMVYGAGMAPAVTMPAPPSVGLPMPADAGKK